MEFRWVVLITLWTLLSGPVFQAPDAGRQAPPSAAAHQPAPGSGD
jgi:hypothetical protein